MISSRAVITYCIIFVTTPASAQPAGGRAEELYDQGRALIAAGKVAEACIAFEESHRLDPAVTTLIGLATCREKLGELANASESFREAARLASSASDAAAAQLLKIARDRAAALELRVPKLLIRVPHSSKFDGLEVLLNIASIPAAKWNQPLPVNGGTYTITARGPGVNEWSTRVTFAPESDYKIVDVPNLRTAQDSSPTPDVANAVPLPRRPDTFDAASQRPSLAPLAVGIGGVALLSGALGLSLWGDSTYNEAKAEMADQSRWEALYNSANRKRYVAQGLAVAGVGCAGVAVWLYLRNRRARATSISHAVELMVVPNASGVDVVGRF